MDDSIKGFFTKNASDNYAANYDRDHGPRLDDLVQRFELDKLTNCTVLDVGGGLGFLGKRLNREVNYFVIDGAEVPPGKQLCKGTWIQADLDYDEFSQYDVKTYGPTGIVDTMLYTDKYLGSFDYAFCLETLEHITNPYHCLEQIKKIVKENGDIYISIPHSNVTHNFIYPGLMLDPRVFQQFLDQMALPTIEYYLWNKGWNCHTWKVRNAPWIESKMFYPKHEEKFKGKTPVEMVNL